MQKALKWICTKKERSMFLYSYWAIAFLLSLPVISFVTRHFMPCVVGLLIVSAVGTGIKSLRDN